MNKFEGLNNLSVNIYELNFYQDDSIWKHKLMPIEISQNDNLDRFIDFLFYINQKVLIKKFNVCFGKEENKYICRRCLNSCTDQEVLINQLQKCGQQETTSIEVSKEAHVYWRDHFQKNPFYVRIVGDFVADNEIEDGKIVGNKTTNNCTQNSELNGYYIISELENVVKSGYYESPSRYDNTDWYVK